MTALQELSLRLSVFTRALPLSTLRQSSGYHHVYRRHHRLELHVSSSPLPVVDWSISVPLFTRTSSRLLSRGTDFLHLGALDGTGNGKSRTEALTFAGSEESNDLTSPTDAQDYGASEGIEDTESPTYSAEIGGSDYVKYVQKDVPAKKVPATNYLSMSDKELYAKCRMDTYRASGPGGQHRNKTDSAVRLTHIPTGLVSQAADDRSQHINRSLALTRLRQVIALEIRDPVELEGYKPPPDLVRILPSGTGGKRGSSQKIGPNHPDFVLGMKALMDLLYITGGSISDAGTTLGTSTGALSKLITSNNLLWQGVNKLRASKGLKPLR